MPGRVGKLSSTNWVQINQHIDLDTKCLSFSPGVLWISTSTVTSLQKAMAVVGAAALQAAGELLHIYMLQERKFLSALSAFLSQTQCGNVHLLKCTFKVPALCLSISALQDFILLLQRNIGYVSNLKCIYMMIIMIITFINPEHILALKIWVIVKV